MSDTTNAGQQQQAAPAADQQAAQQQAAADARTQQASADGQAAAQQQQQRPSPASLAGSQRPAAAGEQQQQEQQTSDRTPDMTGWPQAAIDAWKSRDEAANRFHAEAQGNRLNAKRSAAEEATQATLAKVAEALGLTTAPGAAPTVESLTEQLRAVEGHTSERDEARKDAAFVRALVAKGLTSDLDYAAYLASRNADWRGVSPDSETFAATLAATVEAISTDPKVVTSPAARRTGAEAYSGASGSEITLDGFQKMNQVERTKLSREQPEEYRRLADADWEAARGR